ncbi:uncharacterized protein LOC122566686 isoform X1 [Bombus pyrosoma]|uniref:uncharacterized protein LOC122566686 isoform X1 n=1 Tax=Bombus pyrosoma TaxID=396416 RepID=UPI001CB9D42A|nr:uncharacterized protein LOC122566686 isoform X1 [Bombus pyrosoma]
MGNPMIVHERSVSGCKVSEKGSEGAQYHENHIGIRRGPRTRDTCDFELEKVNTRSARWRGMSLLYRCADSTRADIHHLLQLPMKLATTLQKKDSIRKTQAKSAYFLNRNMLDFKFTYTDFSKYFSNDLDNIVRKTWSNILQK